MSGVLVLLLQAASMLFIVRALLSWLPSGGGSSLDQVRSFVFGLTEPVLAPIRQVMPRMGGIDLSVLAVLLFISFVLTPIAASL